MSLPLDDHVIVPSKRHGPNQDESTRQRASFMQCRSASIGDAPSVATGSKPIPLRAYPQLAIAIGENAISPTPGKELPIAGSSKPRASGLFGASRAGASTGMSTRIASCLSRALITAWTTTMPLSQA